MRAQLMSTTAELSALEKAAEAAKKAHRDLVRKMGMERDELVAVEEARIDAEVTKKYAQSIASLVSKRDKAVVAYENARIAASEAETNPIFVEGTVWEEWSFGGFPHREYKTGKKAAVEIARQKTIYPSNLTYCKPECGALFLRQLKTDGTPSKVVAEHQFPLRPGGMQRWRPCKTT